MHRLSAHWSRGRSASTGWSITICACSRGRIWTPTGRIRRLCEFLAAAVSWSADAVRFGLKRCSVASMCRLVQAATAMVRDAPALKMTRRHLTFMTSIACGRAVAPSHSHVRPGSILTDKSRQGTASGTGSRRRQHQEMKTGESRERLVEGDESHPG
jgi:hypothetical protein